jgi:hypothetical protein
VNVTSLFEGDIPGGSNIGKQRNFFTAQSRCPPTPVSREANIRWRKTGTAGAEKLGERLTAFFFAHKP